VAVAVLDTPFIYIARRLFRGEGAEDDAQDEDHAPADGWQTARKH
jgi:hypothetical protein